MSDGINWGEFIARNGEEIDALRRSSLRDRQPCQPSEQPVEQPVETETPMSVTSRTPPSKPLYMRQWCSLTAYEKKHAVEDYKGVTWARKPANQENIRLLREWLDANPTSNVFNGFRLILSFDTKQDTQKHPSEPVSRTNPATGEWELGVPLKELPDGNIPGKRGKFDRLYEQYASTCRMNPGKWVPIRSYPTTSRNAWRNCRNTVNKYKGSHTPDAFKHDTKGKFTFLAFNPERQDACYVLARYDLKEKK